MCCVHMYNVVYIYFIVELRLLFTLFLCIYNMDDDIIDTMLEHSFFFLILKLNFFKYHMLYMKRFLKLNNLLHVTCLEQK